MNRKSEYYIINIESTFSFVSEPKTFQLMTDNSIFLASFSLKISSLKLFLFITFFLQQLFLWSLCQQYLILCYDVKFLKIIVGQQIMFHMISAPTQKSLILTRILGILAALTLIQCLFLMFTYSQKSIIYIISFVIYLISIFRLSYFSCVINQGINITLIWFLLLEMAIKLKIGLYQIYLSSQGIYKMSSLIYGIVSLYFNFITYKEFKQISFDIYKEENADLQRNQNDRDGAWQRASRDRSWN